MIEPLTEAVTFEPGEVVALKSGGHFWRATLAWGSAIFRQITEAILSGAADGNDSITP